MDTRTKSIRNGVSSPDMAKTTQIQLRVTDDTKATLRTASKLVGESLSEFILKAAADRAADTTKRTGRYVAFAKIGTEEIAVADLLRVEVVMRPAGKPE